MNGLSGLELRKLLRLSCEDQTQETFARTHGVSKSYLNQVIRGVKAPGPKMLASLGLKRTLVYTPTRAKR
jgi:hypothetical protein